MESSNLRKNIESTILNNYLEYTTLFMLFQSEFLTGVYKRYQDLENGNLTLYFARQAHQDILRQRDYDLNYNISYKNFWKNHDIINPKKKSIIKISEDLSLPKETTRRKILQLIKQKVLNKKNKTIAWLPSEEYKKNYNLFINKEIDELSQLMNFICKKLNIDTTSQEIAKELKDKFSFYWFHHLTTQLEYIKIWTKQFKDLELVLIFIQVITRISAKAKEKSITHENLYKSPWVIKSFEDLTISATSISEVTGIPRATCVRKLEKLVSLKMILQDNFSKRYFLSEEAINSNIINKNITENIVKLFSEFYFICIKAINLKFDTYKD
jgi:hypothetical protein